MYRLFEKLLHPYPEAEPPELPKTFFSFVWACTAGMRGYLVLLAFLSAAIATWDAWLFAVLGHVVDWLTHTSPEKLWQQERGTMLTFLLVLFSSVALVGFHTFVKHQTLAINFPLRLRWNFHRMMLGQSLSFYSDEFAGTSSPSSRWPAASTSG